jgi:hypothetical protein
VKRSSGRVVLAAVTLKALDEARLAEPSDDRREA